MPVIALSTADIYSPFVGDAEAEVRRAFSLARQASPCMLFIDELDSIVTNREASDSSNNRGLSCYEGKLYWIYSLIVIIVTVKLREEFWQLF